MFNSPGGIRNVIDPDKCSTIFTCELQPVELWIERIKCYWGDLEASLSNRQLQDKTPSLCTASLPLSSPCNRIKIRTPNRHQGAGIVAGGKKLPSSDSSHLNLLNRVIKPRAKAPLVY